MFMSSSHDADLLPGAAFYFRPPRHDSVNTYLSWMLLIRPVNRDKAELAGIPPVLRIG
jgi:hypothetical protein